MDDVTITDDVELPADYKDSWSVRLGGQQAFGDKWIGRSGVFYETSGIPASTQSVSLVDGDKFGYGLGGSYRPSRDWSIDFGVSQSFPTDTEAKNSQLKQISVDALTGDFLEGTTIGNGKYSSSLLIFGAGVVWEFGSES
jgi:long-chain fatty acid transport protein